MQFEQSSPSQLINRPHTWALIALILSGRFNATTVTKGREWYDIDTYENWASNGCGGIVDDVNGVVVRYLRKQRGEPEWDGGMVLIQHTNTRCAWAGWRNIMMCKLPWFFRESSVSCYLLCYSRALGTFFWRISDSRFTWIHDFKE
jgi:hypothetical protein